MKNPNEYDDDAYTKASNELFEAVANLWNAGASQNDIESDFAAAMDNAAA